MFAWKSTDSYIPLGVVMCSRVILHLPEKALEGNARSPFRGGGPAWSRSRLAALGGRAAASRGLATAAPAGANTLARRLSVCLRPGHSEPSVGGHGRPGNTHTSARAPGGLRCCALWGDGQPGWGPRAQGVSQGQGSLPACLLAEREGRADAPVRCGDTSFSQGSQSRAKSASRATGFCHQVYSSFRHNDTLLGGRCLPLGAAAVSHGALCCPLCGLALPSPGDGAWSLLARRPRRPDAPGAEHRGRGPGQPPACVLGTRVGTRAG